MPLDVPEAKDDVGKKLTGFPINLQSLAQSAAVLGTLITIFVIAERRITTVEVNVANQAEVVKEMRQDLKTSLKNQEEMLRGLKGDRDDEAERGRTRRRRP